MVPVDSEHRRVDLTTACGDVIEEVGERGCTRGTGEVRGEGEGGSFSELDTVQAYWTVLL